MNREIRNIIIIGSGNVAWHLGKRITKKGFNVIQVFGRNEITGRHLARETGSEFVSEISLVRKDADIYILSVSDDAIEGLADRLAPAEGIFIHTAGSVEMDVFKGIIDNYGVLYPLQTFTRHRQIDFEQVPLFVEAGNTDTLRSLKEFASALTPLVYEAASATRLKLHLAAIFACNFTNHMYYIADMLLKPEGLPFEILLPLIMETAGKVSVMSPAEAQTGPAARDSLQVMDLHLKILGSTPSLVEIYDLLSKSIRAACETV